MNDRNKIECLSLACLSNLVKCLRVTPGAYSNYEHSQITSVKSFITSVTVNVIFIALIDILVENAGVFVTVRRH